MDPLKTYDYLEQARRRILDWTRRLSPEQYTQKHAFGLGSIARTLTHIMISEWYYILRMQSQPAPPYPQWPIKDETPPAFDVLEREWRTQAETSRSAITSIHDWTTPLDYQVEDQGKTILVTASRGDIFTQLVLHEVHHRAQVMAMLRQFGIAAEDLDYNALMYVRLEL